MSILPAIICLSIMNETHHIQTAVSKVLVLHVCGALCPDHIRYKSHDNAATIKPAIWIAVAIPSLITYQSSLSGDVERIPSIWRRYFNEHTVAGGLGRRDNSKKHRFIESKGD